MKRYTYCYRCQMYYIAMGQQTRCLTCEFELAELSTCGMLHAETAERLQAKAQTLVSHGRD